MLEREKGDGDAGKVMGKGIGPPPKLCVFEVCAFSITPVTLLAIKAAEVFIIRLGWDSLLTLVNSAKFGKLLNLSMVQLSHQFSVLGGGTSSQYYYEYHMGIGCELQQTLSKWYSCPSVSIVQNGSVHPTTFSLVCFFIESRLEGLWLQGIKKWWTAPASLPPLHSGKSPFVGARRERNGYSDVPLISSSPLSFCSPLSAHCQSWVNLHLTFW